MLHRACNTYSRGCLGSVYNSRPRQRPHSAATLCRLLCDAPHRLVMVKLAEQLFGWVYIVPQKHDAPLLIRLTGLGGGISSMPGSRTRRQRGTSPSQARGMLVHTPTC